ncbi:hypothetical protein PFISCL1PPCAC_18214, partial [Pristionchus fissidentatus]
FDLESMLQVSQTMHAYVGEVMAKAEAKDAEYLSISQCSPSGHAFQLENFELRGAPNYMYRLRQIEYTDTDGANQRSLYEYEKIYTGRQQFSEYFVTREMEASTPDPMFFTRLKFALQRKSFKKLRIINLGFDLLSKCIQMFMDCSFQAIHIGLPLIKYPVHRRILTKLLLDLSCQEMIIEDFPEITLDTEKDAPLFNELFVQNFVKTGHTHYCIHVQHKQVARWDPVVVTPSRTIAFEVLPRFQNFNISTW